MTSVVSTAQPIATSAPIAPGAPGWRSQSACAEAANRRIFFPVGMTGQAAVQIRQAKTVCGECPVQQACLDYAITTNQEYGIWGGTSEEERRVLRRKWRAEQRALRVRKAS